MGSDWDRDLADARVDEAAHERRRSERESLMVSAETTFDELLDASSARGVGVKLWMVNDPQPRCGRIASHGSELVTIRSATGALIILVRDQIVAHEADAVAQVATWSASATPDTSEPPSAGGRAHDVRMVEMLAELSDRVTPVSVRSSGVTTRGTIVQVGEDVVDILTPDGSRRYLAVRSVTEVWLETPVSPS